MHTINHVLIECNKPPVTFHATSNLKAKKGVTSATFSFNLHPANNIRNADLAQHIVDELSTTYPNVFEPCVSFGQGKLSSESKVYITVPATSTQGAITKEDKQQQAISGVQLIRFSVPPKMNHLAVKNAVKQVLMILIVHPIPPNEVVELGSYLSIPAINTSEPNLLEIESFDWMAAAQ